MILWDLQEREKVQPGRKNCIILDCSHLFFDYIYKKMLIFQFVLRMSVFKRFFITIVLFSTHIFSSFRKG